MSIFRPLIAAILFACLSIGTAAHAQTASENGLTEEQIQSIVRDYLLENPEIVIEAIETYQRNQRLAEEQKREQALSAKRNRSCSKTRWRQQTA